MAVLLYGRNSQAQTAGIPIRFTLEKPRYVTLVVEDARGRRVRNLIFETLLPAGENSDVWDGLPHPRRANAVCWRD